LTRRRRTSPFAPQPPADVIRRIGPLAIRSAATVAAAASREQSRKEVTPSPNPRPFRFVSHQVPQPSLSQRRRVALPYLRDTRKPESRKIVSTTRRTHPELQKQKTPPRMPGCGMSLFPISCKQLAARDDRTPGSTWRQSIELPSPDRSAIPEHTSAQNHHPGRVAPAERFAPARGFAVPSVQPSAMRRTAAAHPCPANARLVRPYLVWGWAGAAGAAWGTP